MCGNPNPVRHRKHQRAVTAAMTGFAIFATAHAPQGSDSMTENQKNLNRAHAAMKEFRAEMETERLRYKKKPRDLILGLFVMVLRVFYFALA
jgi:hypothetical protein